MDFSDIEILNNICKTKYSRLNKLGTSLGYNTPAKRESEIVKPKILTKKDHAMIIAEIKRASPTQGNIGAIENPLDLANKYIDQGADAISILCEKDYFKGSLLDLYNVKRNFSHICVLRKDFILTKEEIKTSYLFGADMVLLIVAIFKNNIKSFENIYREILRYDLTALIELHDTDELKLLRNLDLSKAILGINSRDLKTFKINKGNAIKLRAKISSNIPVIFESGLNTEYEAFMIGNSGFQGILCGSSLVRNMESDSSGDKEKLKKLKNAFIKGTKSNQFLANVCSSFYAKNNTGSKNLITKNTIKPLVKICGINNLDFMQHAVKYADLLGFILAEDSKRYVDRDFCLRAIETIRKNIPNSNVLRIGVVTQNCLDIGLSMLKEGILDALQLHAFPMDFFRKLPTDSNTKYGNLHINAMYDWQFSFYPSIAYDKNIPSGNNTDYNRFFDLYDNSGGMGLTIDTDTLLSTKHSNIDYSNIWLAGGISIENIKDVLKLNPMLIDINSGLESKQGVKNTEKLEEFFESLHNIQHR